MATQGRGAGGHMAGALLLLALSPSHRAEKEDERQVLESAIEPYIDSQIASGVEWEMIKVWPPATRPAQPGRGT